MAADLTANLKLNIDNFKQGMSQATQQAKDFTQATTNTIKQTTASLADLQKQLAAVYGDPANVAKKSLAELKSQYMTIFNQIKEAGKASAVEVGSSFDKLVSSFKGLGDVAQTVLGVMGGFGAAALVGKVLSFAEQVKATATNLDNLSKQTGISISTLRGLQNVAEASGTSIEQVSTGIRLLMTNLGRGIDDTGRATKAMANLGLEIGDVEKLASDPEGFLLLFAQRLAQLPTQAERFAAAQDLAGRAGSAWVPVLEKIAADGLPKVDKATENAYKTIAAYTEKVKENMRALEDWFARALSLQNLKQPQFFQQGPNIQLPQPPGVAAGAVAGLGALSAPQTSEFLLGMKGFSVKDILKDADDIARAQEQAAKRIQAAHESLTKSLQTGITSLQAESIAYDQSKEAAERFKVTQAALEQVGGALNATEKQLIETHMALWKVNNDVKESTERAKNMLAEMGKEAETESKVLKELTKQAQDADKAFADWHKSMLDEMEKEALFESKVLKEIAKQDPMIETRKEFQKNFTSFFDSIGSSISSSITGFQQGTQTLKEAGARLGQSILAGLTESLLKATVLNPLHEFVSGLAEELSKALTDNQTSFKEMGAQLGRWIIDGLTSNSSSSGFGGLFSSILGMFGGGGGAISTAVGGSVSGFSAGGAFAAVPFLQHGGLVQGPFIAGESGRELIVPLPDRRGTAVIPSGGSQPQEPPQVHTRVEINGDITPKEPGMTKDQVIKVFIEDFHNGGATRAVVRHYSGLGR